MKKSKIIMLCLLSITLLSFNACASNTHSGQALRESVKASSHASASVGHTIIASGQVASAAIAAPLAVVGSVGQVSTQVSKDLVKTATAPIGSPLEITDESVILGPPPNEALNEKPSKQ